MRVDLCEVDAFVKTKMSEERYDHVINVVETATELAAFHGVDVTDAAYAAVIHDVAKEQPSEQTAAMLRLEGEGDYLNYSEKVWHAPMGAIIAKKTFLIEDEDILNAIKYHTTGRANMSDLEKVIFVADYIEPDRTFPGAIKVRELREQLDLAVCEILRQKVEKVKALDLGMHPDTLAAYAYYKHITKVVNGLGSTV